MHPKKIVKVKLFSGIMFSDNETLNRVIEILKNKYGEIDFVSEEYPFDFTDYYKEEMGISLKKKIISFKKLIGREKLVKIKLDTNEIEDQLSKENKRAVNLDPGYLTLHNVILASAKELPHKIYLAKGIFGDVQLEYRNKHFIETPRAFPDYRTEKIKQILEKVRNIYKTQLR
jgi:hypothetical protein